jgi:hypothetical protein
MKDDLTYNEVDLCKQEILEFVEYLKNFNEKKIELKGYDIDFIRFTSKQIIFVKYLLLGDCRVFYFKVLVSDLYYLILSIIKLEPRYMYLNERSIIENYTRLISKISVVNDHVTENSFIILKNKSDGFKLNEADYSLLKSEYVTSCGFVHGSNIIENNLSFVFQECIANTFKFEDRAKYYNRIKRVIKYLDTLLIMEYPEFVSGCFHRKKALLAYLLGENQVNKLFDALNDKKNT